MTEPSKWAVLVPELLVADIGKSLWFWRDVCGFTMLFDRPEEGFAYLDLEGAQVMLDEIGKTRDWITATLESPLGRGVNLQIRVPAVEPILAALARAGWPLFMGPEHKRYRTGEVETGVRQFLVQDPDGYLIRFSRPSRRVPLRAPVVARQRRTYHPASEFTGAADGPTRRTRRRARHDRGRPDLPRQGREAGDLRRQARRGRRA